MRMFFVRRAYVNFELLSSLIQPTRQRIECLNLKAWKGTLTIGVAELSGSHWKIVDLIYSDVDSNLSIRNYFRHQNSPKWVC